MSIAMIKRVSLPFVAVASVLLTACQPAATETRAPVEAAATTAVAPTQAVATAAEPAADHCFIQVDGKVQLDAPCPGHFTVEADYAGINTGPGDDPVVFASLSATDGVWNASWSGEGGATHAHDDLGEVTRNGRCWSNAKATLCVPQDGTSPQTTPET